VAVGHIGARNQGFDWDLAAVVLTGLGTTALAAVTGLLSWATWQDVRASQRAAKAAEEQLEMAREEQLRRPSLALTDDRGLHSRVETDRVAYVRVVVSNEPERRAARGTRVLIDRYWPVDDPSKVTTLGSPSLGWPSATAESADASVVVFAGASRPVDFGVLLQHEPGTAFEPVNPFNPPEPSGPWHLRLALAGDIALSSEREYLPPGAWVVRLILGADEVDGQAYDVAISWADGGDGPAATLESLAVQVRRASA
jgi:type II secretory pathway pseudopilin PulG